MDIGAVIGGIQKLLDEEAWEKKLGGLLASKVGPLCHLHGATCILTSSARSAAALCQPPEPCTPQRPQVVLESRKAGDSFHEFVLSESLRLLEDGEVRVRLAAAACMGALAAQHGIPIWLACKERVLTSIYTHFVRRGAVGCR